MLIDTHCHIDQYPNPFKILNECQSQNITVLAMTNLPSHFAQGYHIIKDYKKIRLALGMHPLRVEEHHREKELFIKYLDKTSYIGEVGLDFSKHGTQYKDQVESFEFILKRLIGSNKLISLHSRQAEKEVFDLLTKYSISNAIFHWYSGSLSLLDMIIEKGFYFSINHNMCNTQKGRSLVSRIPLDRILTESDGPYLNMGSRQTKPSDIKAVLISLSKILQIGSKELEEQIHKNFMSMINVLKLSND